jgi:hypothetical protein
LSSTLLFWRAPRPETDTRESFVSFAVVVVVTTHLLCLHLLTAIIPCVCGRRDDVV